MLSLLQRKDTANGQRQQGTLCREGLSACVLAQKMAPNIEFNTNTLTTNGGTPVANNSFTLRAGPRGTLR